MVRRYRTYEFRFAAPQGRSRPRSGLCAQRIISISGAYAHPFKRSVVPPQGATPRRGAILTAPATRRRARGGTTRPPFGGVVVSPRPSHTTLDRRRGQRPEGETPARRRNRTNTTIRAAPETTFRACAKLTPVMLVEWCAVSMTKPVDDACTYSDHAFVVPGVADPPRGRTGTNKRE